MVDVVSQYEKYATEINRRILNVIQSGCYIKGKEVEIFEHALSNFLNSKHTISCANGTDALYIALMSLNLNRGDEILVPAFTFVSTIEAVCLLGLKPIFLDVHANTFLLKRSLLSAPLKIQRTKHHRFCLNRVAFFIGFILVLNLLLIGCMK